jgi:hypothetical protein
MQLCDIIVLSYSTRQTEVILNTLSPKVRKVHLQVCSNGHVAIPLSGKMEWLQIEKITACSRERLNGILYKGKNIVQPYLSSENEVTLFIR